METSLLLLGRSSSLKSTTSRVKLETGSLDLLASLEGEVNGSGESTLPGGNKVFRNGRVLTKACLADLMLAVGEVEPTFSIACP